MASSLQKRSRMSRRGLRGFLVVVALLGPNRAALADAGAVPETKPARGSIELNPLPLMIDRWSVNAEWPLAEHHALTFNFAYQGPCSDMLGGVMGEAGYRYYAGQGGLAGLFFGASAVAGSGTYKPYEPSYNGSEGTLTWFGGALDVGYQFVWERFLLGVGAGVVAHTKPTPNAIDHEHVGADVFFEAPILPRITLAAGYVFR
jgi:hypothetical protein